jgi:hypothetical protein
MGHHKVARWNRGRVSDPLTAALSGSHFRKPPALPGSAGGWLRVPSMFGSLEVQVLYPT